MAAFAGKTGAATIGGVSIIFKDWMIQQNVAAIEVTALTDAGVRRVIPGIKAWSGSFEGFVDGTTNASIPSTLASGTFLDANNTYAGNLVVTGLTISNTVDGAVTVSGTFEGDGALTIT